MAEKYPHYKRRFEDGITENLSSSQLESPANRERGSRPQSIVFLKRRYDESLVGEIIETLSGSHYVVRKVIKEGLEASPLGEYRSDRPHIVTLPNSASGTITDRERIASRHRKNYKNILLEIKEEGGDVEMPPENSGLFDLF